jgi:circadian clock protein KaiC
MYRSPVELQIDSILVELFRTAEDRGVKRVVIDALGELYASADDPARLYDYLYALIQHFTARGVSSVLTFETAGVGGVASVQDVRFSYVTDNIVVLDTLLADERSRRTARVLKTRNSPHDPAVRDVVFGADGARIVGANGAGTERVGR